ncbi:MAG TPA: hypothetical protein VKB43_03300 [Gaiellaceae bacterium]|nr:hypothetical protein [Gaiellaceae bacterium]
MSRGAALAVGAVLAAASLTLLFHGTAEAQPHAGAQPFDSDLTLLQNQLPLIHPNVDLQAWDDAVAQLRNKLPTLTEDQADVGFMELVASLGDRNGHTGIFPLDPGNQRAFHEYPFLVYEFADGVYVTGQLGGHDLVGARLIAVGGIPIAQVLAQVAPLVPHDNETSGVSNVRGMYLLSEEVLDGLGIAPHFDFTLPNGTQVVRTPTPVSAAAYSRAFDGITPPMWPHGPAYAPDRRASTRVSLLAHGRTVYLAYNTTTVDTTTLATRILRLASKPRVRRVVVDLRNNRGGDNHTYPPLIQALKKLRRKHKAIVVLAGRATFSAAANFLGDLERATRYLLVGEDSGGAPNLYGDVEPLDLPETGLRVEIATTWWVKSKLGANDPRVTFHPDVVVPPTAKSWFAGRDPALAAALTAPFSKAHPVH